MANHSVKNRIKEEEPCPAFIMWLPPAATATPGTIDAPFRTINHAAQLALPDDTVRVREGVYREWVDPAEGGLTPASRITYEAMPGDTPLLKLRRNAESMSALEKKPEVAASIHDEDLGQGTK